MQRLAHEHLRRVGHADGNALAGEGQLFRQRVQPGFVLPGQGRHAPAAGLKLTVVAGANVQMGLIVAADDAAIWQITENRHDLAGPGRADAVIAGSR